MVAWQATGSLDSQGLGFLEKSSRTEPWSQGAGGGGAGGGREMPPEFSPWSSSLLLPPSFSPLPSGDLAFAD